MLGQDLFNLFEKLLLLTGNFIFVALVIQFAYKHVAVFPIHLDCLCKPSISHAMRHPTAEIKIWSTIIIVIYCNKLIIITIKKG